MKKFLFTILFSLIIFVPLTVSTAGINDALGNLGIIYKQQGNYAEALEVYLKVIKLQPNRKY